MVGLALLSMVLGGLQDMFHMHVSPIFNDDIWFDKLTHSTHLTLLTLRNNHTTFTY